MEKEFKSVLVMSLPNSWDHFIASYQGTHIRPEKEGERGITSQELTSVLIDEYQRRLDSNPDLHNWALWTKTGSLVNPKKRKAPMTNDILGEGKKTC